jgi:hypothetical protein
VDAGTWRNGLRAATASRCGGHVGGLNAPTRWIDFRSYSNALESGVLSLDKVVELARFVTTDDEKKSITSARPGPPLQLLA